MQGPQLFKIRMHNDDVSPFGAVVNILIEVFGYTSEEAAATALTIHNEGVVVVREYIWEIAESTVRDVDLYNENFQLAVKISVTTQNDENVFDGEMYQYTVAEGNPHGDDDITELEDMTPTAILNALLRGFSDDPKMLAGIEAAIANMDTPLDTDDNDGDEHVKKVLKPKETPKNKKDGDAPLDK